MAPATVSAGFLTPAAAVGAATATGLAASAAGLAASAAGLAASVAGVSASFFLSPVPSPVAGAAAGFGSSIVLIASYPKAR